MYSLGIVIEGLLLVIYYQDRIIKFFDRIFYRGS